FEPSVRGLGYKFGADVVQEFTSSKNIDLIVRAHQVVQYGYEFFVNKKLVTVFSAPAYCGQFDNLAGMLFVSETLACKFYCVRAHKGEAAIFAADDVKSSASVNTGDKSSSAAARSQSRKSRRSSRRSRRSRRSKSKKKVQS
uniref:protein-serine/threonine phosphatase n=1 Tax=Romanomermis culicivorax TaxID=13658 RepID=A0A915IQF3_ROMCU